MPALYVIRHAEPETCGVFTGQSDPSIGSEGREKAARIRIPACPVYSSPLRRARETAGFLSAAPVILPGLAEISYGAWDGLSWREIESRWPDLARRKLLNWQETTPPGGETWGDFFNRAANALCLILAGPLPCAVVAHEAVNAIIAQRLVNIDVNEYRQHYCEIKQYEI